MQLQRWTTQRRQNSKPNWQTLRLKDRITPGVRVLLVGINPGVRSAETGHHFAGLVQPVLEAALRVEAGPRTASPTWTTTDCPSGSRHHQLIARPSPGIDDLRPPEYR